MIRHGNNRTEQAIIRGMGGTPHKNSGRGMVKGDGVWNFFVLDVKEVKKSFTLNSAVWSKICTDAARVDVYKEPALIVVLHETNNKLAVIPLDVLQRIVEELEELRAEPN